MTEHEADYEPVMPFVTVASRGGPHDDQSYAAGYAMGLLDQRLTVAEALNIDGCVETIRTTCTPQADLIAMRHGYVMETDASEIDEWVHAIFQRSDGGAS